MKDAIILTWDESDTYHPTAEAAVHYLAALDWEMPDSVLDYKRGVAQRATVLGFHLLFWDYTSFLLAGQSAGVWKVSFIFGGEC